jgi:hypothetical protein
MSSLPCKINGAYDLRATWSKAIVWAWYQ